MWRSLKSQEAAPGFSKVAAQGVLSMLGQVHALLLPGTSPRHLQECVGLLRRKLKSWVAAPASSKFASQGISFNLEEGPWPVAPWDLFQVAPECFGLPWRELNLQGSTCRLLQGSKPRHFVHVGGSSMPCSSLGLLPGRFGAFWPVLDIAHVSGSSPKFLLGS